MADVTKYYILVMNQDEIANSQIIAGPEELISVPEDPEGGEWIELLGEDLGEQTLQEFAASHKPVYVGATPVFDSWAARDSGLGAVQSAPLNYDGSNTPTVTLSGGVASSDYSVHISVAGILCDVSEGTLDGSGGAILTIKNVSATEGNLIVLPRGHSDFEKFVHVIEYEDWSA